MFVKHTDNYNIRVLLDNGDEHLIFSSQLLASGSAKFQGWPCNAGYDYIFVDSDDSVWAGQCQNEYLGNLAQDRVNLLESPGPCKRKECTPCPSDLSAKKIRP
jgi:hypothetical protein